MHAYSILIYRTTLLVITKILVELEVGWRPGFQRENFLNILEENIVPFEISDLGFHLY